MHVPWRNASATVLPEVLFSFQMTLYPSVSASRRPCRTTRRSAVRPTTALLHHYGRRCRPGRSLIGGSSTAARPMRTVTANTPTRQHVAHDPGVYGLQLPDAWCATNCAATSDYGTGCDGLALRSLASRRSATRLHAADVGHPIVSPISFIGWGSAGSIRRSAGVIGMPGCSAYTNPTSAAQQYGSASATSCSHPGQPVDRRHSVVVAGAVALGEHPSDGLRGEQRHLGPRRQRLLMSGRPRRLPRVSVLSRAWSRWNAQHCRAAVPRPSGRCPGPRSEPA